MDLGGYHARAGSALGIRIIAFSSVFCGISFPLFPVDYLSSFYFFIISTLWNRLGSHYPTVSHHLLRYLPA